MQFTIKEKTENYKSKIKPVPKYPCYVEIISEEHAVVVDETTKQEYDFSFTINVLYSNDTMCEANCFRFVHTTAVDDESKRHIKEYINDAYFDVSCVNFEFVHSESLYAIKEKTENYKELLKFSKHMPDKIENCSNEILTVINNETKQEYTFEFEFTIIYNGSAPGSDLDDSEYDDIYRHLKFQTDVDKSTQQKIRDFIAENYLDRAFFFDVFD